MPVLSRFALLLLLVLAACAPAPSASPTPDITATSPPPTATAPAVQRTAAPSPTPVGTTIVRFAHAAPDLPAITIYAGSNAVATNLAFGQSTEPTTIQAGEYTLRATESGSRSDAAPLFEQPLSFQANDSLLLVLTGTGETPFQVFPQVVTPLGSGESAVTLINLLDDAPPSYAVYQGDDIVATPNVPDAIAPIRLSSGASALELRDGADTLLTLEDNWPEGIQRTLILAGDRSNPTTIAVDTRAPGRTALRVLNATATAVDVYLDATLLAAGVEPSRTTDRRDVITGAASVRVFAAGANPDSDSPLLNQPVTLDTAPNSTLYLLGSADKPLVAVYPDDLSPTLPGDARITFVNTLDHFPTVRLETGSGTLVTARFAEAPATTTLIEGSYSLIWIGTATDGSEATVELADDVQFDAGHRYLYLVTGRTDSPPLVLGDRVGVAGEAGEAAVVAADSAQVRLVNALHDQPPVTFLAGDAPLATVDYGQASELVAVPQRSLVVGAQVNGSVLATADLTLDSGRPYTIVAYGAAAEQVNLLVISDTGLILAGDAPHLRLINASLDSDVALGLGYSEPAPAIENLPEGTDEPTLDDYRRSIPLGLFQLVNDVPGGAASGLILMSPGTFNLYVLDSNLSALAATLDFVDLQAGAHYDVFAYQEPDSPRVRAFLLAYPARAD
ncbi:MAG: DUF4397 domain-containing protein [Chloroflexi bacterium]|nr:DUF4397 domain-containing protein [Chloroflexota bacterium]